MNRYFLESCRGGSILISFYNLYRTPGNACKNSTLSFNVIKGDMSVVDERSVCDSCTYLEFIDHMRLSIIVAVKRYLHQAHLRVFPDDVTCLEKPPETGELFGDYSNG